MKKLLSLILVFAVFFTACDSDDDSNGSNIEGKAVYVINEGSFLADEAEITKYVPDSNLVQQKIFNSVNGRPLGSLLQSMTEINDEFYIVLNGTSKVEIVNKDFETTGEITGVVQPRYIHAINDDKAYLTAMNDGIYIIDLSTNTVTGQVPFDGWSERIEPISGNRLAISHPGDFLGGSGSHVFILDTEQDRIVDSIATKLGPNEMVYDGSKYLWVFCDSVFGGEKSLQKINVETLEVESDITFSTDVLGAVYNSRMQTNATRDSLFFLYENGIKAKSMRDDNLHTSFIETGGGLSLYGFGIDTYRGQYYILEGDFNNLGTAHQYNGSKQLLRSFETGLGPNSIVVEQP